MSRVGYRAGPVERKTEFQSQFTGGSRSTGYFGTGYYFTTKPEYCMHLDDGERPLYKLTFKDDLKWLVGDLKKHESLKKLSAYVYNYDNIKKYDDTLYYLSKVATDLKSYSDSLFEKLRDDYLGWGKDEGFSWVEWRDYDCDIMHLMSKLKECPYTVEFYNELASEEPDWDKLIQMEKNNPVYFDYDWVDSLRELKFQVEEMLPIRIICEKEFVRDFAGRHINYQDDNRYSEADSIMTVFLKELGYDGVWPSPECDNTTYGGVIFEKDSIANIELLAEKGNQYIKENCMRKTIKSGNIYDYNNCSFCGEKANGRVEDFLKQYGFEDIEYSCDVLDVDPNEVVCEECFKSWLPELNSKTYSEYDDLGVDIRTGEPFGKPVKSSHWVGSITGYGYTINDESRDIYNVEDFMNVIKDLSSNGYSFEYHNKPLSIPDVKSYCFEDGEPIDNYNIDIVTSSSIKSSRIEKMNMEKM